MIIKVLRVVAVSMMLLAVLTMIAYPLFIRDNTASIDAVSGTVSGADRLTAIVESLTTTDVCVLLITVGLLFSSIFLWRTTCV